MNAPVPPACARALESGAMFLSAPTAAIPHLGGDGPAWERAAAGRRRPAGAL